MEMQRLDELAGIVLGGGALTREEAYELLDMPLEPLLAYAEKITRRFASRTFGFCAIRNAKSGRCGEDCRWCAQSRHWPETHCPEYPLVKAEDFTEAARRAAAAGIPKLSIVTSGRKLSARETREAAELARRAHEASGIEICASVGLATKQELETLFEAGVVRLHCNLEASRRFFPKVCTTHSVEDKLRTLRAAKEVGMDICSGGIIGMGESREDRLELALELRALETPSIPINILSPIPGTPLADEPRLEDEEILRTIAFFRFLNPSAALRFAGGRRLLSDELVARAMKTGINAEIVGELLTTSGVDVEEERRRALEAGYRLEDDEAFDRAHLWHPYDRTVLPEPRLHVESASGVRLRLKDGRELIDGTSAWWCAAHGYAHPKLVAAVQHQAQKLPHVMFGGLTHDPAIELGRKLLAVVPEGLDKIFYADSGSVAIEAAMKMALQYQLAVGRPERTTLAAISGGYHGDTWNAMSVCDPKAGMHGIFGPTLPVRRFVPAPASVFGGVWDPEDIEPLERLLETENDIAALVLEPVFQGASAMRFYHPAYLTHAKRLCEKHDVLLIADEIATGFWRTGRAFACQWAGITPDIMTIGKALTGGMMTLSAVLASSRVADSISRGSPGAFMHGPTYMANPLACAAAAASLDLFASRDYGELVRVVEAGLKRGLEPLRGRKGVVDVRVLGAVGVVELERPADRRILTAAFADAGVWARPFDRFAYLMPPLVMTPDDLDRLTAGFRKGLEAHFAALESAEVKA